MRVLTKKSVLSGIALSVLVVAVFTAETFDNARAELQSLGRRDAEAAEAATPFWLWWVWTVLVVVGGGLGVYVQRRFDAIAERLKSRRVPELALATLLLWFVWQVLAIAVVLGAYGIPWWLILALHVLAVIAAIATLLLGGAAAGDASVAIRRSLVRLHGVFLLVLFVVVFRASFVSDQLTDVLRGWGDGNVSRPLAGIAAALLLGAVVRASATRVLLPTPASEDAGFYAPAVKARASIAQARGARAPRLSGSWLTMAIGVVAFALGLRALGIALAGAGVLTLLSRPAEPETPLRKDVAGLRRLAGSLGVAPVAILLVGLTGASVNSLLLPSPASQTDAILLVLTVVVVAAFGVVVAHAYMTADRATADAATEAYAPASPAPPDPFPGELFGLAGLLAGLLSLASALLAALVLLALAVVLASRYFGERGAFELWTAWGVGAGLALAVYVQPVQVPRGVGGFGIALFGATAILAALHPVASMGARRRLRFCGRLRIPVISALVVWFLLAWPLAPVARNQVGTVNTEHAVVPLQAAVDEWADREADATPDARYIPMLLVGASGGGAKAAYWTDLVLDCVFGADPRQGEDECPGAPEATERSGRLFLTSSVSGGSVGIFHYLKHADKAGRDTEWTRATVGEEVLSPLLAWGLFHDLPAYLIGAPTDPRRCADALACPVNADRALVQAAAVANDGKAVTAKGDGLLAQSLPITVFNTAQVPGWDPFGAWALRRIVISRVALAQPRGCPGEEPMLDTLDGHDLLARGQDLTLANAALLSARFPFLEPPGRVGAGVATPTGCNAPRNAKIRDGGTYENSGLLTLSNLLRPIQRALSDWQQRHPDAPPVRPIVLSIDDDPEDIDVNAEYDQQGIEPHKPGERTKDVRARLERCAYGDIAYRRLSPVPHVGAQAATGWEVSQTSRREDLVESLLPARETGRRVAEMRTMLDGTGAQPSC